MKQIKYNIKFKNLDKSVNENFSKIYLDLLIKLLN